MLFRSLQSVQTEWYDLRDPVVSAHDKVLVRSEQMCERFVQIKKPWGNGPVLGHACTIGNLKTRCDGYFTAQGGKGPRLNEIQALTRHLAGDSLVAMHAEIAIRRAERVNAKQAVAANRILDRIVLIADLDARDLSGGEIRRTLVLRKRRTGPQQQDANGKRSG